MKRKLLTAAATLAVAAVLPSAASAAVTLQPGAYHETDAGSCTLNFAYTGGGKTYLGTAAHCVASIGQQVRDIDGTVFGKVAFIGDQNTTAWDFAFIEVDPEDLGRVSPAVKGWPAFPKGATTPAETLLGDSIQLSGYGLGYDTTPATQEQRRAVMGSDDASTYTRQRPDPLGRLGRTARPHRHRQGARASSRRLCAGTCSEEGPTVQGIIAKAASRGFTVSLRTI